ncbi:MerR family DNA-binding transcriptional regulator [Shimazuella alba]|uniref:MerR family DNA-binding transcriptional regulator n=1 Tax=Shimazuella alba TaxID=2690964 RepID=A0A6I4VUR7_9BACL|nr:MerR family DNA-binding transcriptional regulator [Shimazuella alba]MXQ55317.1 MerR family DNA-binding transcriptional regulator [Shimazuella alba]
MNKRPIDIARKLKLSTSALRHYESRGLIPIVQRSASGYRIYTEEHVAYFECIQAMSGGFGMDVTSKVLRCIQIRDIEAAFSLINEAQANLYQEKKIAEKLLDMALSHTLSDVDKKAGNRLLTIGEVSAETHIPASAIRHWEKIGLITPDRDKTNNYRLFKRSHIRKILIINSLRPFIYSIDLTSLKQALKDLDHHDAKQTEKIAHDSLRYIHKQIQNQVRGIHYLYRLCIQLQLIE